MRRALLMCRQDTPDLVAVLIQCIEHIEDRAARIAEDGVDAMLDQYLCHDLRPCQFHEYLLSFLYSLI